jgi:hypothetical protein
MGLDRQVRPAIRKSHATGPAVESLSKAMETTGDAQEATGPGMTGDQWRAESVAERLGPREEASLLRGSLAW